MNKTILTNRSIKDFKDLEKEINALMTIFLKRPFEMREESLYSKYKKTSFMLFIQFCNENMFRYGSKTNRAISEYFNDYTLLQIRDMHKGVEREIKVNKTFKSLYELTENVGIKMVTERWVRSKDMQVQFIDRQINILRERKKTIEKTVEY
tara:strand:+ start:1434 stop:1886 length:453 start_codon:yes stop_codon:yes gene_type:complete